MGNNSFAHPRITLLDEDQKALTHRYALDVLSQTGVRVDSPDIRKLLSPHVGASMIKDDIVRFPSELVEWAIQAAPKNIAIYNRQGDLAFNLGSDRHRFGIGVTSLYYQDPVTDELVKFARPHMEELVRLGDRLPLYDVVSTVGILQDVSPQVSDLYATLDMIANTRKPLVLLISDEYKFPDVLNLLEHLHGDLGERPFIIPYFNPVSPLVMNDGTLYKIQAAIQRGIPFIYSNYGMTGMSTPITSAGTLVILLAELLAGITTSQVMKEGTPIIAGMLPAYFDMKTMVNFYDSKSMLVNLACAEMMAYYNLPHAGTSGSGNGWGPDLLSAEMYWMNHMTFCLTKGGLSPFVGDTLTSKAFSPTNAVYVHEIIQQILDYAKGFELTQTSACLDEIQEEGPGGHFLTSPTTLMNYKTAYYTSPIFPRYSMEKWVDEGRPDAMDILRQYTRQLLSELQAPEDHDELQLKGDAFIRSLG